MSYPHKLPTILVLAASIIVFLSSLLCLAFKMSAYTSYIDQGSWGTSMLALKSSSYNVNGWIAIYPEHLMSVTRAPLVLTASLGLVTGLAVTWLATRHLITKRVLLVCYSFAYLARTWPTDPEMHSW